MLVKYLSTMHFYVVTILVTPSVSIGVGRISVSNVHCLLTSHHGVIRDGLVQRSFYSERVVAQGCPGGKYVESVG